MNSTFDLSRVAPIVPCRLAQLRNGQRSALLTKLKVFLIVFCVFTSNVTAPPGGHHLRPLISECSEAVNPENKIVTLLGVGLQTALNGTMVSNFTRICEFVTDKGFALVINSGIYFVVNIADALLYGFGLDDNSNTFIHYRDMRKFLETVVPGEEVLEEYLDKLTSNQTVIPIAKSNSEQQPMMLLILAAMGLFFTVFIVFYSICLLINTIIKHFKKCRGESDVVVNGPPYDPPPYHQIVMTNNVMNVWMQKGPQPPADDMLDVADTDANHVPDTDANHVADTDANHVADTDVNAGPATDAGDVSATDAGDVSATDAVNVSAAAGGP